MAIIGAGPVGLAAAAHVLERGMKPLVLEAGPTSAMPCGNGAMCACSRPGNTTSTARPSGCWRQPAGIRRTLQHYPTGAELVERYLEPLATRTALKDHIRTTSRVTGNQPRRIRQGQDQGARPGAVRDPLPERQGTEVLRADAVIDASGTWLPPNPAGANGLAAIGERAVTSRIAYGMPDVLGRDREPLCRQDRRRARRGHSAIGTLIDLARLKEEAPRARSSSGCCAATSPRKPSAAAPTTSSPRAASWARLRRLRGRTDQGRARLPRLASCPAGRRLRIGAGTACCGRHLSSTS